MLKSSGMHIVLPCSIDKEVEIWSSGMIFAQGSAVIIPSATELLLLDHTWVGGYKQYLQTHMC